MGQFRKTKVAFFFLHMHKGGMQRAVSRISLALEDDFEQWIVFFGTENPGFLFGGKQVNLDIPGSLKTGPWKKVSFFFRRRKLLQQFIVKNEIDVLVSFGEPANFLSFLVKVPKKVFSVRTFINKSLTGFYGMIYRNLVRLTYPFASQIVAVSEDIQADLIDNFHVPKNRVQVIQNFFDHQKIIRNSELDIVPEFAEIFDKPVVISVGSLTRQKGFDHLIKAFRHAKKNGPDLQLVILGAGEESDCLKKLVKDLKLQESVHFLGFQANPYQFLRRSDVFVLSSHLEGFPNVLVEAMICGIPVVATDCRTGPREILGVSRYGILIEDITEEDAERVEKKMGESISALLEEENKKKFKELSYTRSADFSKELILPKWKELLQE